MPIPLFARLRSALSLLLLLAVAASLLPTRQVAAQTRTMTREQVNPWLYRQVLESKRPGRGKALDLEIVLQARFMDLLPNMEPSEMTRQMKQLKEQYYTLLGPRGKDPAYRKNLPYGTVARAMFDAAIRTPTFRGLAAKVNNELRYELANSPFRYTYTPQERAIAKTFLESDMMSEAYRTLLQETIDKAFERAQTDPPFAQVWDDTIAPEDGPSIANFDSQSYLAANPLILPAALRDNMRPDGSMEISLAELQTLAAEEFGKINASIDDIQRTLGTISAQQQDLVDFMRDEQARREAEALAEAKAREHQLKLEAAGSAVSIISTLASFIDPQRGRQIAVVGQSAIQVAESFNGWSQAVAGLSSFDKLTSLSTVVMTGNVLGAVMNIMNLFGDSQPSPDQMILEEIGKLRQQVSELRVEMHERFDRVDAQLNAIYATMQERFNQIDLQLGKINGSLEEIHESLLTLGLALDRLERNNFEYLDAVGRRPLLEAMNGALGYQQRTGLEMPYQPEFVGYENSFHTWGTVNAFDALSAGPTQRDYSDAAVLGELSSAPLDANLNYLNGWLVAHGMQPFASKRLASPRDWAFASRAYADLGLDWPAHMARIDPRRQASLDAVGAELEAALRSISTVSTPEGPRGNTALFTGVLTYYTAKLDTLDGALTAKERAFTSEVRAGLGREAAFNLFGGLDQQLDYQPTDFVTMSCGAGLSTPSNLKNIVPEYSRQALADYLRLSTIKVCLVGQWINEEEFCVRDPYNPGNDICEWYGNPQAMLTVYSDDVPLASRTVVGGDSKIRTNAIYVIADYWESDFKPAFEGQLAGASPPQREELPAAAAAQLAAVSAKLTARLADYQRALYGQVLGDVSVGSLKTRAVELAGAKKLLESFLTLGFPQAVANDDLLHSLLLGDQSLVDDQQLVGAYARRLTELSSAQAITQEQLMTNPRVVLKGQGYKRGQALGELMGGYFAAISAGSHSESSGLIADARFDLLLAQATASPGGPPTQPWRILLPVLQR